MNINSIQDCSTVQNTRIEVHNWCHDNKLELDLPKCKVNQTSFQLLTKKGDIEKI